jgi:DNA-binding response OmpR family regulator
MPNKPVLIVEDDPVLAEFLKRFSLQAGAVDVDVIRSGYEMDKMIKSKKYGLVLLDILLPGQTGMDLLKVLKNNKETVDIPVVVVSNVGDQKTIDEVKSLGAAEYVVKVDADATMIKGLVQKYLR